MDQPSLLVNRLGTNYSATDQERAHIQVFLPELTTKLASLQKEMDDAHAHYMDIKLQHTALLNNIEQYQLLMVPVRRMPDDIIQEIFRHCMPQKHNAIISVDECPLLLGRICSRWRAIALNTGSLWASIHIPIPVHIREDPLEYTIRIAERRVEAILEWIERSAECLLDITLHNVSSVGVASQIYQIIIDSVLPFAERWGRLTCNAPPTMSSPITDLPVSMFPNLHTMSFVGKHINQDREDPRFWISSGLIRAPNLRNITFTNMNEDFLQFPLRWDQLTYLSLEGTRMNGAKLISLTDMYRLLFKCPLLRFCHLKFYGQLPSANAESLNVMSSSILLCHLTNFAIHADTTDPLSDFLDSLNMPILERLQVHGKYRASNTLPTLLVRTNQTLQSLKLDPYSMTYITLIECLHACPNLVELEFNKGSLGITMHALLSGDEISWKLDDKILQLLTIPPLLQGHDVFLPKLKSFCCTEPNTFTDSGLLAFLESRTRQNPGWVTLKHVSINLERKQELPMLNEIEKLEQGGMKCTLRYSALPLHTRPGTRNHLHSASEGAKSGRQEKRSINGVDPTRASF